MKLRAFLFSLSIFCLLTACKEELPDKDIIKEEENERGYLIPELPEEVYDYNGFEFPEHMYQPPISTFFLNNDPQVDNHKATLGRVLFYDFRLSESELYACASCHHQDKAFTDGQKNSKGNSGEFGSRNSMSIVNMIINSRFFWDYRANSLEDQATEPIFDVNELGLNEELLLNKLDTVPFYDALFTDAFGDETVSSDRVAESLSEFMRSIVSYDSKYDRAHQNDFIDFSEQELLGRDLFFSGQFNCNHCHFTNAFSALQTLNNGLDETYADAGVGAITGAASQMGQFKVPTLRNIALTAPYMHDGRFQTLEEVIDHYNEGIKSHPYLDDRLATDGTLGGPPKQYNMTEEQKSALIAFLLTLTDETLLENEMWSDPFVER